MMEPPSKRAMSANTSDCALLYRSMACLAPPRLDFRLPATKDNRIRSVHSTANPQEDPTDPTLFASNKNMF